MKSYIKLARQPEVIRTTQKDLQYTSEINQNVLEIVQFLAKNNISLIKFTELSKRLSSIFYHGFATINQLQTLGEEYTGIIQIDQRTANLPSKLSQLFAIIVEFAGESFFLKILKLYEQKIENNEELLPEVRRSILQFINIIRILVPYVKALHRGLFYLNSGHFQIAKRLTGINYVLVRFWLNEHHSLKGYKFLGVATILQVLFSLYGKIKEKNAVRFEQVPQVGVTRTAVKVQHKSEGTKKCVLCLEIRTNLASTSCGHLFCWTCILELLGFKGECPLCREPLEGTPMIFLQNYC